MDHTQKSNHEPAYHYTPSPQMADKLATNRTGQLTKAQRLPITIAAIFTGSGFLGMLLITGGTILGLIETLEFTGVFGLITLFFSTAALLFILAVLWVNAQMFVPEALNQKPVRWSRGPLKTRKSARDRPELPFSYIIDDYSFAPFVGPPDVPLQKGRQYIVYYTARSRLLMSIAPIDQPDAEDWLPKD
ncbi:MAG: hypothetical protein GYB66_14495 [Chloroflexi bacterium]|nr:hypothetical protein [Chloroflexota bacterium]